MKKITIFQEGVEPIILEDNDTKNIEEYTKELLSLLNSNNITMLTTSKSSVLIRPSKIVSTYVQEIDQLNNESEDFITDT